MGYRNLRECVLDLERTNQLVRLKEEVDPFLEVASIQRRVYAAGGPAILYERVKGCDFPLVSNLFGTLDRARFLFRDTLEQVRRLVELKIDPSVALKRPWRYAALPMAAKSLLPKVVRRGPILDHRTTISRLPAITCWPKDGGGFITLPQVYSEDIEHPGLARSNLGMYRVQLTGNEYERDREVGLHYQIHRGIGVHHAAALRAGKPFAVNVFVGGPPSMMLAAVMPLPEGLSELGFAGLLGGRRLTLVRPKGELPFPAEADFVLTGVVNPNRTKPEGPFGDHLGYYSLRHEFPVLEVTSVRHRADAIWPFTVVGRPPQEDTTFGELIHELTGPIIPTVVGGIHAVHAVDATGVHPLLLAIGSERYVPYQERREPQELLTSANALLGQGQLSLAKYLLIVAKEDDPNLDIHDIPAFFRHLLERFDPRRDLHFQTKTTIDTLDYSGAGLNQGSKLVLAAVGPKRRSLAIVPPPQLSLPSGFSDPQICLPGVLAVAGPGHRGNRDDDIEQSLTELARALDQQSDLESIPLIVVVDDSGETAASLRNFLWITFTRSNPSSDVIGVRSVIHQKHWGCDGPLIIDARRKPWHAEPLIEDPNVESRVDSLASPGGPLHGIL